MARRDMSMNGKGFAEAETEPAVYNQSMQAMNEDG
jgi:hypothetical protein